MSDYIELPVNQIELDRRNPRIASFLDLYGEEKLDSDTMALLLGTTSDSCASLTHTSNGQLQSVKGIGAMIYITDKVNISANARRTFIEVTDSDSLEFLKMLAEFVNTVYDTRYALSNYISAKAKQQASIEKIRQLRIIALENLRKLAKEDVEVEVESDEGYNDFFIMSDIEKKRAIKKKISDQINLKIKEYIKQLVDLDLEHAYQQFIDWIK